MVEWKMLVGPRKSFLFFFLKKINASQLKLNLWLILYKYNAVAFEGSTRGKHVKTIPSWSCLNAVFLL